MKHPHEKRQSLDQIFRRSSLQFFLFSAALMGLLMLSRYVLLPPLTQVEVSGSLMGLQELQVHKQGVEKDIIALEKKRNSFLSPQQSDIYRTLQKRKLARMRVQDIRKDIGRIAKTLVPDQEDVILLLGMEYDGRGDVVEIWGEVRNVGTRSMTVLAQFVESLRDLRLVKDIDASRYTRREDQDGSYYSPFDIYLLLE